MSFRYPFAIRSRFRYSRRAGSQNRGPPSLRLGEMVSCLEIDLPRVLRNPFGNKVQIHANNISGG
jgi:hypothetical protein